MSCKDKQVAKVSVKDDVGHVGIYASPENLNIFLDLVQAKYPLLDSHLIIDDFSGDIRFENKWNFTPIDDVDFIKNHRLVITDESVDFPENCDTVITLGKTTCNIYLNPFGLGQSVIEIVDFDENTITSNQTMLELDKVIDYCNRSIPLESNEYTNQLQQTIKSQFGITIEIPSSFKIFKKDSSFIWVSALKANGGYLSLCIENIPQEKFPQNLQQAISERNESTKKHFFNDEGTTMAVSDLGNYKPKLISGVITGSAAMGIQGWFTELGTTRRGPFERRYFKNNNRVVVIDWFSQGGSDFSQDARLLRKISLSARLIP